MNKFRIYAIAALVLLIQVSCSDFLEKAPLDFMTPDVYFDTEQGMDRGVLGIYDALQASGTYRTNLLWQFAVNTDIEVFNRDITGTNGRTTRMVACAHNPDNAELYQTWVALYDGVGKANEAIWYIEHSALDDSLVKNRYIAEARALRALFYLNLTVHWRDVPMRLKPVISPADIHIEVTKQSEIYRQIINDLTFAVQYLPSPRDIKSTQLGRMTNTAAMGLLARTNLYMAGAPMKIDSCYNEVIKWTQAIVKDGFHELNPDYHQIFINQCADIYEPKENLFEVFFYGSAISPYSEFGTNGTFNGIKSDDETNVGFSYGNMYVTPYLFKLFQEHDTISPANYTYGNIEFSKTNYPTFGDKRAMRIIANFRYAGNSNASYFSSTNFTKYPGKWRRTEETNTPKGKNQSPTNVPVLRYADVLLMMAEAYNGRDGSPNDSAYWAINQVRRRAFEVPVTVANAKVDVPAGLDGIAFLQWVKDERARELAFEGLRKIDLLRWDTYVSYMKAIVQTFPSFSSRNLPGGTGAGKLNNEHIGRACQIYDYIDTMHVVQPIPQRELDINNKIEQHLLWQ